MTTFRERISKHGHIQTIYIKFILNYCQSLCIRVLSVVCALKEKHSSDMMLVPLTKRKTTTTCIRYENIEVTSYNQH